MAALAAVVFITAAPAAQQPIRLVVMVVLDQFRAEYLTTFASHWRDGFRTLLSEGAVFTRAAYPYFHTDTCAGHFTIGTGTLAAHAWHGGGHSGGTWSRAETSSARTTTSRHW